MFHGALSALDVGADTVAAEKLSECDRGLNANLIRRGFRLGMSALGPKVAVKDVNLGVDEKVSNRPKADVL